MKCGQVSLQLDVCSEVLFFSEAKVMYTASCFSETIGVVRCLFDSSAN
jgi:hypothetical protein